MFSAHASRLEWVSGAEAMRILGGISYATLQKLVARREIRIQLNRGEKPTYSRADCNRIVGERIAPVLAVTSGDLATV
jgi:hypothetical protein